MTIVALCASPTVARADSEVVSALKAIGYVVPTGCSAIDAVANGAYMSVGDGAPMYLRATGVVCGVVAIGVGTYVLATDHGTAGGVVQGVVPISVGIAAIIFAIIVGPPQDLVGNNAMLPPVTPIAFQGGGAGLAWQIRF